jgi:hypothetical protein
VWLECSPIQIFVCMEVVDCDIGRDFDDAMASQNVSVNLEKLSDSKFCTLYC